MEKFDLWKQLYLSGRDQFMQILLGPESAIIYNNIGVMVQAFDPAKQNIEQYAGEVDMITFMGEGEYVLFLFCFLFNFNHKFNFNIKFKFNFNFNRKFKFNFNFYFNFKFFLFSSYLFY